MDFAEPAPAKLNLALHVRGKLPDGRHRIETIFAFCTDGDRVAASAADHLSLQSVGPFASEIGAPEDNLVLKAARALREAAGVSHGAALTLTKNLPVAAGLGGGSADAAATLRLLTRLWDIDPAHSSAVMLRRHARTSDPNLGATARGTNSSSSMRASATNRSCS